MVNYCPKCGDIVKGSCSKCASAGLAQKADSFAADGDAPVSVQYTDAYVSSGLEEDMDTGLRRMADVRPELQDKDCYHCNRKCTGGAVAGPYGPNRGKPFCQTCFANIYDREKCEKCGKSILGSNEEWVEQDGKKYHGSCFEDKDCEFCHQPIIGSGLEANGKMYHPNCFTCEECQKPIAGGAYAIFRGAPYCQPCHSEVAGKPKASSVSSSKTVVPDNEENRRIDRNNAAVQDRRSELDELRKQIHVGLNEHCAQCQKELLTGAIVMNGLRYHQECFVCAHCGKDFPDLSYVEEDGEPYHEECIDKLHESSAPTCGFCNKALSGKYVDINGSRIHSSCFNCTGCKKNLVGVAFGEVKDQPYCDACMVKAAPRNSATHTNQFTPGFTVNPLTLEKQERAFGGARLGGRPPGIGGGDKCQRCEKVVYMSEKVPGPVNTVYHRKCLTCKTCSKPLDSNAPVKNNEVYCRGCLQRA